MVVAGYARSSLCYGDCEREKRKKHRGRNRSAASGRVQSGDLYEACFDDDDGVNSRGVVGKGSSVREGAWLVVDCEIEGGGACLEQ